MTLRVIAIDGPAGAGKSTVARAVAAATGLPFLDTGAMYRCVALAVLRRQIPVADDAGVAGVAASVDIAVDGSVVRLDGEDVSTRIRTTEVNSLVSVIASNSGVRRAMRAQQRRWAQGSGGVVEGRDIGTVVFPDAVLKVFLTASPRERAHRRALETGGDEEEIARAITERDHIDSTREDSPLRPADGSVTVDSTGRSIEQVVAEIVGHYERVTAALGG